MNLRFYNFLIVLLIVLMVISMIALFIAQNARKADKTDPIPKITEEPEPLSVLSQPMDERIVLDDFSDLSDWRTTGSEPAVPGIISIAADKAEAEMHRKFEGFLALKNYLYFEIEVENPKNIQWMTLYLMENLDGTNCFEYDLVPRLHENKLIINQKDFSVGKGDPKWDSISTVKIAFQTNGQRSELRVNEFSTFDASPVCTVWFDDAWKSTYSTAYPMMRARGFKGTVSVIGSHAGYDAYCDESELRALYDDGWDLVNHTYSHKNLDELTLAEAEDEIAKGFDYLKSRGFTRACNNFVPPFGPCRKEVVELIKKYAVTSRPNWDDFNYLPIIEPYSLCYWEVTADTPLEKVYGLIREAIEHDLWLVLLFHSIESPADASTQYEPSGFEAVMDLLVLNKSQIRVAPLSEVLSLDVIGASVPKTVNSPAPQDPETGIVTQDGWRLVWEDEFESAQLDESFWNVVERLPGANNELQTYSADCVLQRDGCLLLESKAVDGAYYSGSVTTDNKKIIQYGKIEIKAKLPAGKGLFPAFWLVPLSGEHLPEIDIMEYLGHEPDTVWHVYHFYNEKGEKDRRFIELKMDPFNTDFHVFALEWTEQSLKWFIDGAETFAVTDFIPSGKMVLILNMAVGGDWPGSPNSSTVFPQSLLIDSVRYYQRQS